MTQDTQNYTFFWKPCGYYGVFSQWFESSFSYDGITFATAEQFMMYKKAEFFGDHATARLIMETPEKHPAYHKELGRQVAGFDNTTWHKVSSDIVLTGNLLKFTQNPRLARRLSETGNTTLVEASPHDRTWGIGYQASQALWHTTNWGENKLGKVLVEVRSVLLQCSVIPVSLRSTDQFQDVSVIECSEPVRITFRGLWKQ